MYKGGRIIALLIIIVALFAIPFLHNIEGPKSGPVIELNTPVIQQLADKQCVESTQYMSASHMQLLYKWRDEYVRDGKTVYINSQGRSFKIGLDTCLNCHSDPTLSTSNQFCVSCHNYSGVKLTCWKCHLGPKGAT
ncbi:sulfate reduction electron transfer complex DsrMKJOP subunit DsrJ [Desulfosporosinus sp. SB140]|uniref:sulfate reduction electron transfer complex DsrMKJOP subunit DsrJ n=1 Tax=Desulfosporosinus paludis TaxID=3115649 RepID=UPI00388DB0D4